MQSTWGTLKEEWGQTYSHMWPEFCHFTDVGAENATFLVYIYFGLNCYHVQQEADYPVHEQIDLYDDVISPSANNGDAPEDRDYLDTLPAPGGTEGGKSAPPNVVYTYTGKRIALYIGNLTWVSFRFFFRSLGEKLWKIHVCWIHFLVRKDILDCLLNEPYCARCRLSS